MFGVVPASLQPKAPTDKPTEQESEQAPVVPAKRLCESLGDDHPETRARASDVAECYRIARRLEAALPLFQESSGRGVVHFTG